MDSAGIPGWKLEVVDGQRGGWEQMFTPSKGNGSGKISGGSHFVQGLPPLSSNSDCTRSERCIGSMLAVTQLIARETGADGPVVTGIDGPTEAK